MTMRQNINLVRQDGVKQGKLHVASNVPRDGGGQASDAAKLHNRAALAAVYARRLARTVSALGLLLVLTGLGGVARAQSSPVCELDRPVRFSGSNWESNLVLSEIERFIMEKGYGCAAEVLPTESLIAVAALENGDMDILPELWINSLKDAWSKAEASGKVQIVGSLFTGRESWYIPRYTAEKLPQLRSVMDLPRFKDYFKDPEEPAKGRIYGCPSGWYCEIVNINLWKAFGLQDGFNMFSPGSGATQKATVVSALQRQEDIVFYYWEPTPLVGAQNLVELAFPPYDEAAFQCVTDPDCADPQPTSFFDNAVFTGVSTAFARQAPALIAFLSKVTLPTSIVNKLLGYMEDTQSEPDAVARWFLQNEEAVWTPWVPADVAARVKAAL